MEHYLAQLPELNLVASCKNALTAFKYINETDIDLLLLDIHMPEMSGVALAKNIPSTVKVIFTTAHRNYAVEGFELMAVDYLLKPIPLERFVKAIYKFKAEANPPAQELQSNSSDSGADFIFVRSDRKMLKVDLNEIKYVESIQDYVKIHLDSGTVVTRETLARMESMLDPDQFLRCHRSFIVAVNRIDSYTNEHLEIQKSAIPISRSYKDIVLKNLKKYGL